MTEDERARFAANLHDGPVQHLTVARMHVDVLRRRLAARGLEPVELEELETALASASDGLREVVAAIGGGRHAAR
jgi:signal transduction histidine kinase